MLGFFRTDGDAARLITAIVLLFTLLFSAERVEARSLDGPIAALGSGSDLPVASAVLRDGSARHHGAVSTVSSTQAICDKDIDPAGSIAGVAFVAAQDNGICTTGEAAAYENAGELYIAQAGGQEAAFTITRIAPDGSPTLITQETWGTPNTYTADIKAFKQGTQRYIALALERLQAGAACGVVIVEVTDAPATAVIDQVSTAQWCDVHNVFVENDSNGDGKYIYLTADFPDDMRVLDISDLSAISEIGRYTHPEAGGNNFVHDMTVIDHGGAIGRRVYVAYWAAGLMILDADHLTPGVIEPGSPNQPLNPDHSIDPVGFLTHDAYPTADGSALFIEDEFMNTAGLEPVQMWDISAPAAPAYVDGIGLGSTLMPLVHPAHNLLVEGNRLHVGWYKAGLQSFDFTASGFTGRPMYHQVQSEGADDAYDGAWNVLLATVGSTQYVFQSDRRYGLIIDAVVSPLDADDDNDLVIDADEGPCGGNAVSAASRPERLDGPFDNVDDDGDTAIDEALPSPGSDAFDCDGDGWTGAQEQLIFSGATTANDQDACGNDGWAADLAGDDNILNIADINSFLTPNRPDDGHGTFNKFGHPLDDDGDTVIDTAMARWNIQTPPHTSSTAINIGDLNSLITGAAGSPARPPMFGSQQAFFTNGGMCPWPP